MESKFAQVVRGRSVLPHKLPFAACITERHALYGDVRERFAVFVENSAGDHALRRQLENDFLEFLSLFESQRGAALRALRRVFLRNIQIAGSRKTVTSRIDVVNQKIAGSIGCGSVCPSVLLPKRPQ